MDHGNVIDFNRYREKHYSELLKCQHTTISQELINAIQNLIQRLREHNPLKQTG